MEPSSGRWVILGAGGFVGSALRAAWPDAICLTRREVDLSLEGAGERLAGLLRLGDTLFFLSAITPDKGRDAETFLKNCRMAAEVGRALAKVRLRQILYASSDAVFAENLPPITEETLPCPNSLYGTMHLAREQMLTEACGKASVPLTVVRLCAVYGVGDTHDSYGPNRFLRTAREQGSIRLFGRGEEKRPHLWIGDAVRGLAALAASGAGGSVHLIPPESFSFADVAEWIRSAKPEVRLEYVDRAGPPSHKFFGPGKASQILPGFRFTDAAEQVVSLAQTR